MIQDVLVESWIYIQIDNNKKLYYNIFVNMKRDFKEVKRLYAYNFTGLLYTRDALK